MTSWAVPFRRQTIFLDEISMAPDESFPALMAVRVLQFTNLAWKIACINISQARFVSYCSRTQQIFSAGIVR